MMDCTMEWIMDSILDTQVWTGQSKILNVGEACAKIYMYIPMHLSSSTLVFIRLIALGDTKLSRLWIVSSSAPGPQPCLQGIPLTMCSVPDCMIKKSVENP